MSFQAEFLCSGETNYATNALRFATLEEAEAYANDLFSRWMAVKEWRVTASHEPVNYRWDKDKSKAVNLESNPLCSKGACEREGPHDPECSLQGRA